MRRFRYVAIAARIQTLKSEGYLDYRYAPHLMDSVGIPFRVVHSWGPFDRPRMPYVKPPKEEEKQ